MEPEFPEPFLKTLEQWFPTRGNVAYQETFGSVWDTFGCHCQEGEDGANGIFATEDKDASLHPTVYKTVITTKDNPDQMSIMLKLRKPNSEPVLFTAILTHQVTPAQKGREEGEMG